MFKKSSTAPQSDLFGDVVGYLPSAAQKRYEDPKAWHNVFRTHVVDRIDETLFAPLFDTRIGRPNAPVRLLVGMLSLKEAFGWSDEQLFEHCQFNLLVRSALGVFSLSAAPPVASTYYLFQQSLHAHQIRTGEDLLTTCFQQVTRGQALDFSVDGRTIRMDATLIGHNIAWLSRTQLVLGTVLEFFRRLTPALQERIAASDRQTLGEWKDSGPRRITYQMTGEEIEALFLAAGELIARLLQRFSRDDDPYYAVLERVFTEQYHISRGEGVRGKDRGEIAASSLQSPYDGEAEYRRKAGITVKGSSVHVTETAGASGVRLITDVRVDGATQQESDQFLGALDRTIAVTGPVKRAIMDGAYNSADNQRACAKRDVDYCPTQVQGRKGRYHLERTETGVLVTDTRTGETMQASVRKQRYRITTETGTYRYFDDADIERSERRALVMSKAEAWGRLRANVEASIFQLTFHCDARKTRYRGRWRNQLWATVRCMWINARRITLFLARRKQPEGSPVIHAIQGQMDRLLGEVCMQCKQRCRRLLFKWYRLTDLLIFSAN
jgi:hypothetical protein